MGYDPTIGKWLEADPEEYVDGPNVYQSFLSNPISYADPSGTTALGAVESAIQSDPSDPHDDRGIPLYPIPIFPDYPTYQDTRATREAFANAMLVHFEAWRKTFPEKCGCQLDSKSLIAQWMAESDWGRKTFVQRTLNFGNIKGTGPAGSASADTGEHLGGKDVTVNAPFRKYNNPEEYYEDYVKLICTNNRYAGARGKSGHAYFQALLDAHYATNPGYVKLCDSIYKQLF